MTIQNSTKLLETHCFIENELCLEYLSNQTHQRLNESIGMVPNLVDYCNVVKKKLYNVFNGGIKANEDESAQFYIVQFSKKDFTGINCFFQEIDATISIAKTNVKSNCLSGHGGYRIGQSGFRQRDKSFNVFISIDFVQARTNSEAILEACKLFAHELTHAYEHFKRKDKSETMQDALAKRNYEAIVDNAKMQNLMAEMLYLLEPIERNAWVGSFAFEISKEIIKEKRRIQKERGINGVVTIKNLDSKTMTKLIQQTSLYRKYLDLRSFIKIILSLHFNKYANADGIKIDFLKAFNDLTNLNCKTFLQMTQILVKRFRKFERKILTQSSKIAYEVLNGEWIY